MKHVSRKLSRTLAIIITLLMLTTMLPISPIIAAVAANMDIADLIDKLTFPDTDRLYCSDPDKWNDLFSADSSENRDANALNGAAAPLQGYIKAVPSGDFIPIMPVGLMKRVSAG